MAKLIFAMNVSLDGYVDHDHQDMRPDAALFRHFIEMTQGIAGSLYGRRLYDLMQYWDGDDWDQHESADTPALRDFAEAWRGQPKWVVSRTLTEVGPNATLISDDVEAAVRRLKDQVQGDVDVGGTVLAQWLGERGLLDEVHMYLHPVVLGKGRPMFVGVWPKLRLLGSERVGADVVWLRYGVGCGGRSLRLDSIGGGAAERVLAAVDQSTGVRSPSRRRDSYMPHLLYQ